MQQLQQELLIESKQRMLTSEGIESLHEDEIRDIANVIVASISGGAWAAMDENGVGSLMDSSNPALADYKNSAAWNPARQDNKIRTRPDVEGQVDIFGNPVNGHGKGGYDLEKEGKVIPLPPSHAIETAMRWMKNGRMRSVIHETVKNFPFGRFIEVYKTK
ncbi:MAG TPA: hypothetical protein VMV86_06400 [Methanosarcinales archaeon]|nr:hypothetical protein [Methanosarcinales archaeon]